MMRGLILVAVAMLVGCSNDLDDTPNNIPTCDMAEVPCDYRIQCGMEACKVGV